MQNQRNGGTRAFPSVNRFPGERSQQERYAPRDWHSERESYAGRRGFGSNAPDDWSERDENNYEEGPRRERYSNAATDRAYDRRRSNEGRGYSDEYEDAMMSENDRHTRHLYDSDYNQQTNRRQGSSGGGYNELNGGRNDQYDRDRYNERGQMGRQSWDNRQGDSNYNSFDQYADRGNYNTARSGGGGYGSTTNRYEDGSMRNSPSGRYENDRHGSYNSGSNNWQGGSAPRTSKQGFGARGQERRSQTENYQRPRYQNAERRN